MSSAPRQLVFDLPHATALSAEHFLVGRTNAAALAFIERWPDGSAPAVLLYGPAGTGKSHLVSMWQARLRCEKHSAAALGVDVYRRFEAAGCGAIEDLDRGIADERLLFHLLNLAREGALTLLLTSRVAPGELAIGLPDLRSRLRALPAIGIDEPDPPLLEALLVKLFADRQLDVEPPAISYLALHMERSAAAASAIVAEVDKLALATRRKITRALAAEVLTGFTGTDRT